MTPDASREKQARNHFTHSRRSDHRTRQTTPHKLKMPSRKIFRLHTAEVRLSRFGNERLDSFDDVLHAQSVFLVKFFIRSALKERILEA